MAGRLSGKVALVTGSTSNIGRAMALEFAREGARVLVTGRDLARGDAVVHDIRERGGEATFLPFALTGSAAAARDLAHRAAKPYGPVTLLVNNAAIYPPGGTLDVDEQTFDAIVGVNVKAPYFLTAALVPGMIAAGGGSYSTSGRG